ncbi:MAG: ATP-binding cassette domain-containing protein, partial [Dehalococcoidales bacterium]|nr:ATP-binding cassette domain-containing protein [Dehalococcoidales bacterium]
MLNICGISKSYGTRRLFSGVTFTVGSNDHVALIGANGTGKTTLFDIIAGRTPADGGAVSTARGATIGYLRQEEYSSCGQTLLEEVSSSCDTLTALADKIRRLQEELATEKDTEASAVLLKKLGELEHLYDARGGYDSSHRAKIILAGLGFSEEDFNLSPLEFSGGWQTRIHLGKLLFINPDILLLDEPTNYLDLETQRWFESYLKQYRGAVLFTSHDRVFINNTADKIIAIEPPEIIFHHGDYDSYVEARKKEEGILQATARRQEESINRQMRFVERFRYKATKARQVQSRIKLL